jgi:hypothetical protein
MRVFNCPDLHKQKDLDLFRCAPFKNARSCADFKVIKIIACGSCIECGQGGWVKRTRGDLYIGPRSLRQEPDPKVENEVESDAYSTSGPINPWGLSTIPSVDGAIPDLPPGSVGDYLDHDIPVSQSPLEFISTPDSEARSLVGHPPYVTGRPILQEAAERAGNAPRGDSPSSPSSFSSPSGSADYPYYGKPFPRHPTGWKMTKQQVQSAGPEAVSEAYQEDYVASTVAAGKSVGQAEARFRHRLTEMRSRSRSRSSRGD